MKKQALKSCYHKYANYPRATLIMKIILGLGFSQNTLRVIVTHVHVTKTNKDHRTLFSDFTSFLSFSLVR